MAIINRKGTVSAVRQNSKPNNSSKISQMIGNVANNIRVGRVVDIVLDEKHDSFKKVGRWNGIGTIFFEYIEDKNSSFSPVTDQSPMALPLLPNNSSYPLINEIVILIPAPSNQIGKGLNQKTTYYLTSLNLWNHPFHNAYPPPQSSNLPSSMEKDYKTTESGSYRRVTDGSTDINLDSTNPSQNTFPDEENEKFFNIHPLLPFAGDNIYEGRFGNSIRLGNTARTNSKLTNNWSNNGLNGSPITIIRNGQPTKNNKKGWIPLTETINGDLSSIYCTSTQTIPLVPAARNANSYSSYPKKKPEDVDTYNSPQVIINSDRLVFNSKKESILLKARQQIHLSAAEYINLDSGVNLSLDSKSILLGGSANQSLVRGDNLLAELNNTLDTLIALMRVLENLQIWPGGVAAPDSPTSLAASNSKGVLERVKKSINSKKGILSTTCKTE